MVSFHLKVLSVMENSSPGDDSVLAEILEPLFTETGVLAGMSGSPVYFEDKLLGAVAFTTSYQKKPIVGITPIYSMIRLIDNAQTNYLDRTKNARGFYGLSPISTPLAVAGDLRLSENLLNRFFPEQKFLFVPGSVDSRNKITNRTFVAGDGIGVNLVSGDMNLSAYGTVTYVSNQYILAFGHPMDLGGKTTMAMHTAAIDAVVPRLSLSYKVGRLGPEVGSVIEDRSPAILGKMGEPVTRIPFKVRLQSELQDRTFNYQIVKSQDSLLQFVPLLVVNSFLQYESKAEPSTLSYRLKIKTDFHDRTIELVDTLTSFHHEETLMTLAKNIQEVLGTLAENRFVPINIVSLDLELSALSTVKIAMIESLVTDKITYAPGDTVQVTAKISHYRENPELKYLTLKLPETLKPGIYPLILSSADFFLHMEARFSPDKYNPQHPNRLLDLLEMKITSKTMSLWMFGNDSALWIGGKEFQRLPTFAKDLMESSRETGVEGGVEFLSSDLELKESVVGRAITRIAIENSKYLEK